MTEINADLQLVQSTEYLFIGALAVMKVFFFFFKSLWHPTQCSKGINLVGN